MIAISIYPEFPEGYTTATSSTTRCVPRNYAWHWPSASAMSVAIMGYHSQVMTQKPSKVINSTTQPTGETLFREIQQTRPPALAH